VEQHGTLPGGAGKSGLSGTGCAGFCAASVPAMYRDFRLGRDVRDGEKSFISELFWLAGAPGFEPRLTESESAVLPLNYAPPDALMLPCFRWLRKPSKERLFI
jgi:hypothetical protein